MGWTSMRREAGVSNADFFAQELLDSRRQRMLEHHTKGRGEFYAAIEDLQSGEVWALVVLMQWNPRSHYNFSYKTMSDSCGPGVDGAPAKVLDLLTSTDSEYATAWRDRCWRRLERRATNNAALVDGATVRLARPLSFSDGSTRDTFTYRRRGASSGLYVGSARYRISNWRDLDLEVRIPQESVDEPRRVSA